MIGKFAATKAVRFPLTIGLFVTKTNWSYGKKLARVRNLANLFKSPFPHSSWIALTNTSQSLNIRMHCPRHSVSHGSPSSSRFIPPNISAKRKQSEDVTIKGHELQDLIKLTTEMVHLRMPMDFRVLLIVDKLSGFLPELIHLWQSLWVLLINDHQKRFKQMAS